MILAVSKLSKLTFELFSYLFSRLVIIDRRWSVSKRELLYSLPDNSENIGIHSLPGEDSSLGF